jgi:TetR/AcrR family transcriptional regulator, cholesterol catabolism regulator
METRERILLKAQDLFQRFGIRSVTMDDIANQLGMSKKTIYQFFADKHELVDAVAGVQIEDNQCKCKEGRVHAKNAIHEVFLTIDMMQQMLSNISPSVFYDLEKFHPKTFSRFLEHRNKFLLKTVKVNLEWGISEELYRPDINIDILTKLRLETMFLPFDQAVFPQKQYNLLEVQKETLVHFLHGVATAKGHKLIDKYKQERLNETKP